MKKIIFSFYFPPNLTLATLDQALNNRFFGYINRVRIVAHQRTLVLNGNVLVDDNIVELGVVADFCILHNNAV